MRGQTNNKPPARPDIDWQEETQEEISTTPLSAEQARQLRESLPRLNPYWIVGAQVGVGLLVALLAGAWSARPAVGWSVAYGALAVAVPAGIFARALARGAGSWFLLWELIKLGLTVAMLAAARGVVPGLSWLALLGGVIVATKMYWVALAWSRRPRKNRN